MTVSESSVSEAVRQIESVSNEIVALRDAMQQHHATASSLEQVAHQLDTLTASLRHLPEALKAEFSGASQLIQQLNTAFQPASALEAAVRSAAKDVGAADMKVSNLQDIVVQQQKDLVEQLKSLNEQSAQTSAAIIEIRAQVGALSAAQAERAKVTRDQLARLTGLVRRGFFALMFGKDAPPDYTGFPDNRSNARS